MKIIKPSVEIIYGGNEHRIYTAAKKYWMMSGVIPGMPAEFISNLIRWREDDLLEHSMVAFLLPCEVSENALRVIGAVQMAIISYERRKHRPANIFSENCRLGERKYMKFFGSIRAWRDALRLYNQLCVLGEEDTMLEIRHYVAFADLVPAVGYQGRRFDLSPYEMAGDVRDIQTDDVIEFPKIITARFRCSRAVAHEISRFKFVATYEPEYLYLRLMDLTSRNEEVEYIEPYWWNDKDDSNNETNRAEYRVNCAMCEEAYFQRLSSGVDAADTALNGDACTEIVQTALIENWVEVMIKNSMSENGDVRRIARIFRDEAGEEFEEAVRKASGKR